MNATELIEQFKRLQDEEKGKVVEFIRQDVERTLRYADDRDAKEAAEAAFRQHGELFRKLPRLRLS